ncbi:hypothetical protein HPB51_020301 [Rhipicephalus microplus]|uniref:BACK domain-containing protein n=1 Tax=Rhipicephalus microplus TaxID=6941 RepID=A0A9J6DC89_RHIMP|nr:hypothetical protein HPB51_020301 [Rhipicephalus microplus]
MCATVAEVKDRAANGADKNDGMVTTSFEAAQLFIDDGRQREFSPAAAARAMPGLREQRKTRQCCDVVFRANYTVEVWAHRFVMSAKYSGCYTLFTIAKESMAPEKRKEVGCPPVRAVIKDLESGMIELLVENAYQIPLHERIGMHNIVKVLKLTEKLKLTQIRDNCLGKVKKDLEPGNCIETYHLATSHGYEFLTGEAFGYLVRSFDEVWKNNAQFEALTAEEMKTVLEDDQLNAPSEAEETFEAILKWISADAAARKEYLAKFRPLVRFVRCSVMEFEKVVSHPEVEGDERSLKVLHVIHHGVPRRGCDRLQHLFVGGFNGREVYHSVVCFNVPLASWSAKANMEFARCHGFIYDMDGFDGHARTRTVERYDTKANQWSLVADMTKVRSDASAAAAHGRIYVAGGFTGATVLDSVESYDPSNNV